MHWTNQAVFSSLPLTPTSLHDHKNCFLPAVTSTTEVKQHAHNTHVKYNRRQTKEVTIHLPRPNSKQKYLDSYILTTTRHWTNQAVHQTQCAAEFSPKHERYAGLLKGSMKFFCCIAYSFMHGHNIAIIE